MPTGSGEQTTLAEVADELSRRLVGLFLRDGDGPTAVFAADERCARPIRTGATRSCSTSTSTATPGPASGASHQTGWTALVAKLIDQLGRSEPGQLSPADDPVSSDAGDPAGAS